MKTILFIIIIIILFSSIVFYNYNQSCKKCTEKFIGEDVEEVEDTNAISDQISKYNKSRKGYLNDTPDVEEVDDVNIPDLKDYINKVSIEKPIENKVILPDMSKYILKTQVPSCPRIPDRNKYILKTRIPPCQQIPYPIVTDSNTNISNDQTPDKNSSTKFTIAPLLKEVSNINNWLFPQI